MTRLQRSFFVLASLWSAWAPAQTLAVGADGGVRATAFGPGEQATYKVRYLGVPGGTAVITVGESTDTPTPVWPIVTLARSDPWLKIYTLKDRIVSRWDPVHTRLLSTELFADENHKRRRQRVELDHDHGVAHITKQDEGAAAKQQDQKVEPGIGDVASVTFALREKPLAVGQEYSLPVFTGSKSIPLRAKVEARERLKTALGEREVFRIRVAAGFNGKFTSKRDMLAFLTTDAGHVPVRIEAEFLLGAIVADLTAYQPGRNSVRVNPG